MIGTISRWGTRGYGFVTCDGLDAEAWLHAKFLDDPGYEPRQGDRVEFELERLADGRYQARRVRPANGTRARASSRPPMSDVQHAYGDGPLAVKLSLPPLVLPSAPPLSPTAEPPALQPSPSSPSSPPFALEREHSEAGALPSTPPPPPPPPPGGVAVHDEELLGHRLTARRGERQSDLERLRVEAAEVEQELTRLHARKRDLEVATAGCEASGANDDTGTIAAYLDSTISRLEQGWAERKRLREAVDMARQHALQRSGLPTVQEYEQLRERLHEANAGGDLLAQKAFRALERERRMTLRELADAHDRLEASPPVRARFVAFLVDGGPAVVVAPLRADDLSPGAGSRTGPLGDVALRIACSFWQAAERASRELTGAEANVEHGRVAGALAVRIGHVDAGLVQLLLDETWAARPSLARLEIEPAFEVVEGAVPPFQTEPQLDVEEEMAALGGSPAGCGLPDVAVRLGLSLRDLVAMLSDRGLPFVDDEIDAGTEETLRALLGEGHVEPAAPVPAPEAAAAQSSATPGQGAPGAELDRDGGEYGAAIDGPIEARDIASRMLRKLLRDRRVGGRHTRIENAYGHHFSDGEKDRARRVAEWLEKDGILLPKLNEGSHHISINPRRLRDVGQIIDSSWERGGELDPV